MADREYLQYVEVDFDYCSRSFGSAPCVANLGQNLLLWSEDLSNAAWTKSNTVVVSNQAKDPEGFVTADRVTNTAANGIYFQTYTPASLANKTYTFSFWANTSPGEVITARAYLYGSVGLENITFTDLSLTGGLQLISRSITFGAVPASPSLVIRVDLLGASGRFLFASFASLVEGPVVKGYSKTEGTRITGNTEFTATRKCFNTFATCSNKANFDKTTNTQTFVMNRSSLPGLLSAYPTLDSVSSFTSTVNLSGGDARYGAFGRRGEVTVTLRDHVDTDSLFDKYYRGRKAGTAQADAVGYDPEDFGTYWTRRKSQWPYYSGKPLRIVDAYLENDVLVIQNTRHFVITEIKGPDDNGKVVIQGKDILSLADDKKALAPKPSRGKLASAVTVGVGQTFTLEPAGIGAEYATSGYATIGSEVVGFIRSVDTITLTERGVDRSIAATHAIGDSFQQALRLSDARIDDTIYDLLVNYAKIDPAFCPKVIKWEPEITRWMSSVLMNTVITKPTGVTQLVSELADLGVSIWWDDVNQEVGLKATHPVEDSDTIFDASDDLNLKAISQEDRNEDRITQVHFYTKQQDPTKDYKEKANYNQINVIVDTEAEGANAYNDTKIREVFCRWFNNGADAIVRVLALRLLKRFNKVPVHLNMTFDSVEGEALALTDVIRLNSRVVTDDVGIPKEKLFQVFRKDTAGGGKDIKVSAQGFDYEGRYGFFLATTGNNYNTATPTQKAKGAFFVGPTLKFADGTGPYLFI